jgi:hypothetical protein
VCAPLNLTPHHAKLEGLRKVSSRPLRRELADLSGANRRKIIALGVASTAQDWDKGGGWEEESGEKYPSQTFDLAGPYKR